MTHIKTVRYPIAKIIRLGFSKDKLAVYEGAIIIDYSLKKVQFGLATISLQACSDKVYLPPQTLTLLLN